MKTSPEKREEVLLLGSGAGEQIALIRSLCTWGSPCCAQWEEHRSVPLLSLQIRLSGWGTGHSWSLPAGSRPLQGCPFSLCYLGRAHGLEQMVAGSGNVFPRAGTDCFQLSTQREGSQ